jgi:hypothetical protein
MCAIVLSAPSPVVRATNVSGASVPGARSGRKMAQGAKL